MNNDELKKKIMEILHRDFITREVTPVYVGEDGKEKIMPQKLCDVFNNLTEQALIPYFADALIAAGIGDVKEAERLKIELKQKVEYIHELWEAKEDYKHRAEVAERALYIAATRLKCRGGIGKGFCRVDECDYYHCDNDEGCVNAHLKQAEKELSEEGK